MPTLATHNRCRLRKGTQEWCACLGPFPSCHSGTRDWRLKSASAAELSHAHRLISIYTEEWKKRVKSGVYMWSREWGRVCKVRTEKGKARARERERVEEKER
ncbi:MAG: hypothetical protein ACKESB_01755 [Candidatus Hodgkinia cicadicola]